MHAAGRHRGQDCSAAFGRVCSHRGWTFAVRSQSGLIVVVRIGEGEWHVHELADAFDAKV